MKKCGAGEYTEFTDDGKNRIATLLRQPFGADLLKMMGLVYCTSMELYLIYFGLSYSWFRWLEVSNSKHGDRLCERGVKNL